MARRARVVWPALWAGVLLCVALIAAPAPFATLEVEEAGRVVARIFFVEACFSLLAAALWLLLDRGAGRSASRGLFGSQRGALEADVWLTWATVLCTVVGYFAVATLLPAAREGSGLFSFGQLHLLSMVLFGVKTLLVLALAWRCAAPQRAFNSLSS
jgi:hypothetical protein